MSDNLAARVAALEATIKRLDRQSRGSAALSRSTAPSNDTGSVQKNQGQIDTLSLRDAMPTLYNYGFSSSLPVGGDKVVVFLNGDRAAGIVVATGHQEHRVSGLATGEAVMHDMWGHSIKMTSTGIIITGDVFATGNWQITGNVQVTGSIAATGSVTGTAGVFDGVGAMGNLRSQYDAHKHTGVQHGSSATDTTDHPA
jgi:phage gp45-like